MCNKRSASFLILSNKTKNTSFYYRAAKEPFKPHPIFMAIATVKTGCYNRYNDQVMNSEVKRTLDIMKESKLFPELAGKVDNARKFYDDYSSFYAQAQSGSKEVIVQKNAAKQLLAETMERLSMEVNATAMGDLVKLLATGMPVVKPKGSNMSVELGKVTDVVVTNSKTQGSVEVVVGSAPGAASYLYEYTLDPITEDSVWVSKASKRKSYVFNGLTSGAKVWFRVAAIGSFEQEMYSDEVSCFIL
jgi:hypothetical protein